MTKYLGESTYTVDGAKRLLANGGQPGKERLKAAIEKLGRKLEAYYYAFGDRDLVVIADMPNAIGVAAISLQAAAASVYQSVLTARATGKAFYALSPISDCNPCNRVSNPEQGLVRAEHRAFCIYHDESKWEEK